MREQPSVLEHQPHPPLLRRQPDAARGVGKNLAVEHDAAESGRNSPATALMIVDLPEPEGPNSTVTPGVGTSNATSIRTSGKRWRRATERLIGPSATFSRRPTHSESSSPTSASAIETSDSSRALASPPGACSAA